MHNIQRPQSANIFKVHGIGSSGAGRVSVYEEHKKVISKKYTAPVHDGVDSTTLVGAKLSDFR